MPNTFLIRPPKVYRWLFSDALFRKSSQQKSVYLTFDDGPHPEATPFVLDVLKEHDVQATFFVLGKNVEQYPKLMLKLREEGHSVGNHGMNHLNGWRTSTQNYLEDYLLGKERSGSVLFRPAYGKLTVNQYRRIKELGQIVFWDVIAGDFDQNLTPKEVYNNVIGKVRNGSIIVLHDSQKALKNVKESLGQIIIELKEKGYEFERL